MFIQMSIYVYVVELVNLLLCQLDLKNANNETAIIVFCLHVYLFSPERTSE